jgi:hypothetical protein
VRRINFFPCHRLPAALAVQEGRKEGRKERMSRVKEMTKVKGKSERPEGSF